MKSPTIVTAAQFRQVTGETLSGESLDYPCNARLGYTVRGIHVGLDLRWNWEAGPGGDDTHTATYRGTRARLEIRHGARRVTRLSWGRSCAPACRLF